VSDLSEEERFKRWLHASKYYQVIRGLSVNEQQIAWDAWKARSEQPATGAQVTDEAVKSAMAAYDAACEDPVFTDCPTCLGHGFCMVGGEPHYCDTCGGAGEIAAPDDDMRCMRAALEAALAQRKAE